MAGDPFKVEWNPSDAALEKAREYGKVSQQNSVKIQILRMI
nr:hypothetical protein [Natranaerobius trueperi]